MFDVHQLQVFLAVAEKLSFTRAAEGLFLTQSAVSHQIAKLESAVSCELLIRQGRAVSLTPAGREMAHQARRVLAAVDEAGAAVRRVANPDQGRLRLGATSAPCPRGEGPVASPGGRAASSRWSSTAGAARPTGWSSATSCGSASRCA